MLETNDLKIFYEVACLRSTIKAANKLGYVQSNISKRIAKLEDEMGKTLFFRTNKGMKLTEDGERFFTYAQKILTIVSELETEFSMKSNHLRIGATQSITKNYLQDYYFDDRVSIFTNSIEDLSQQLKSCRLDGIIINKKLEDIELKEVKHFSEPIFWSCAIENNQALLENKIIVSRDKGCPYRLATVNYLKRYQLTPNSLIEVDTMDTLIAMVENKNAVAVLPERTINTNNQLKKMDELTDDPVTIYVYSLKNSSLVFDLFD